MIIKINRINVHLVIYFVVTLLLLLNTTSTPVTICIDPGHGGIDPGALGIYCNESYANLEVAMKTRDYLEKVVGITEVSLTRYGDYYVSLADRVSYANTREFDRFVSIHHNAFDTTVQGTETFCHPSASVYSFDLRDKIHSQLLWAHKYHDRGVKTADFYVLRETTMPAVLGEASFIDYCIRYDESYLFYHNVYDHVGREGYAYCSGLCEHYGFSSPDYGEVVIIFSNYPSSVQIGDKARWCTTFLNNSNKPKTFDYWVTITGPRNATVRMETITLRAYQDSTTLTTIQVPQFWPLGVYLVTGNIGILPDDIWDSDSFLCEVTSSLSFFIPPGGFESYSIRNDVYNKPVKRVGFDGINDFSNINYSAIIFRIIDTTYDKIYIYNLQGTPIDTRLSTGIYFYKFCNHHTYNLKKIVVVK